MANPFAAIFNPGPMYTPAGGTGLLGFIQNIGRRIEAPEKYNVFQQTVMPQIEQAAQAQPDNALAAYLAKNPEETARLAASEPTTFYSVLSKIVPDRAEAAKAAAQKRLVGPMDPAFGGKPWENPDEPGSVYTGGAIDQLPPEQRRAARDLTLAGETNTVAKALFPEKTNISTMFDEYEKAPEGSPRQAALHKMIVKTVGDEPDLGSAEVVGPNNMKSVVVYDRKQGKRLYEIPIGQTREPQNGLEGLGRALASAQVTSTAMSSPEVKDYYDTEAATLDTFSEIDRVLDQTRDPNTPIGAVAATSRFADSLHSQLMQGASLFGEKADVGLLDPGKYKFADEGTAAKSARVQSNMTALAFTLAAAQNKGRVTEADVQKALDQLGARSGSKAQLRAALLETKRRQAQSMVHKGEQIQRRFNALNIPAPPISPVFGQALPALERGDQEEAPVSAVPDTPAPSSAPIRAVNDKNEVIELQGGKWVKIK